METILKSRAKLLNLLVAIGFASAQIASSTTRVAKEGAKRSTASSAELQLSDLAMADRAGRLSRTSHLFPVHDDKGLLLICIAPEIDVNPDTDLFKHCTLAPGRTLDDVMHSFIGAIHVMQKQDSKESDGPPEDRDRSVSGKSELPEKSKQ